MSKIWTGERGLLCGQHGVLVCDTCPCPPVMIPVCNCESGWPSVLGVSWTLINNGSCTVCDTIFDGTRYDVAHAGNPASICAGFAGNGDVWLSTPGIFNALAGACAGLANRSIGVRLSGDRFDPQRCAVVASIFADSDRDAWIDGSFCGSPGTCSGGFCMNGSAGLLETCPIDLGDPYEIGLNDSTAECIRGAGAKVRIHFT